MHGVCKHVMSVSATSHSVLTLTADLAAVDAADLFARCRLPVVNFAAGGVASPADAALMMQMGVDGVFVGSGIFKSGDPAKRARAIVQAVTHYNDPKILAEVSCGLGEAMVGIDCRTKDFNSYAARSE